MLSSSGRWLADGHVCTERAVTQWEQPVRLCCLNTQAENGGSWLCPFGSSGGIGRGRGVFSLGEVRHRLWRAPMRTPRTASGRPEALGWAKTDFGGPAGARALREYRSRQGGTPAESRGGNTRSQTSALGRRRTAGNNSLHEECARGAAAGLIPCSLGAALDKATRSPIPSQKGKGKTSPDPRPHTPGREE